MNKEDLKKRLEETKAKIKANSKDAHFADALISDLLSLKGQLAHEPTMVHIALDEIEDSVKGDTFEMCVTKSGDVIYHVYGGYTVIADGRMVGLNKTIQDYIYMKNHMDEYSDEEKELIKIDLDATGWVLSAPMYAFSDHELKYTVATDVVRWINETYDTLMAEDLKPEDKIADANFERQLKYTEALHESIAEAQQQS